MTEYFRNYCRVCQNFPGCKDAKGGQDTCDSEYRKRHQQFSLHQIQERYEYAFEAGFEAAQSGMPEGHVRKYMHTLWSQEADVLVRRFDQCPQGVTFEVFPEEDDPSALEYRK